MIRAWLVLLAIVASQGGVAPVIDGHLGEHEWAGAKRAKLQDGGEIQLLPRGEFLFVSIVGPRSGLASVCIARGKTIRILHASAAIAEAAFEQWGDIWMKRKNFEWTLRDARQGGGPSDEAKIEWLAKSGWLANASAPGSPKREFKILATAIDYIGITFLSIDEPMTVSYWPATMNDDCRSVKIPQGYLPDTARFDPASWHRIVK